MIGAPEVVEPPNFARSEAALRDYDASWAARRLAWEAADTDEAVRACVRADEDSWEPVWRAFWEDTKDRNNASQACLIDEKTLRRWVKEWRLRNP